MFLKFRPNEIGASSPAPFVVVCWTVVQTHCTSLQNFAICETAGRPQSAPAHLSCRFVCTTSGFAQKKDANPVGGRGISAFSADFFEELLPLISGGASTCRIRSEEGKRKDKYSKLFQHNQILMIIKSSITGGWTSSSQCAIIRTS